MQRPYKCGKVSPCLCVTQEHVCHTMGEEQRPQREDMQRGIDNVTKVRRLSLWLGWVTSLYKVKFNWVFGEKNNNFWGIQKNSHDGFCDSKHMGLSSQQCSSQSPLKKLFGLRRSGQSKHNITPVGFQPTACTNWVTNTDVVMKGISGLHYRAFTVWNIFHADNMLWYPHVHYDADNTGFLIKTFRSVVF